MRYIRTKDAVYKLRNAFPEEYQFDNAVYVYSHEHICKNEIIKEGDSVAELCDVIVCNEELFYPLTSYKEGNEFDWKEIIECSHNVCCSADYKGKPEDLYFKVYGAIWTDKGLIYVAKMNEKGELELL